MAVTGDLGVSMTSGTDAAKPVVKRAPYIPADGGLSPPLHGGQQNFAALGAVDGKEAIDEFFSLVESLACGIALFDDR